MRQVLHKGGVNGTQTPCLPVQKADMLSCSLGRGGKFKSRVCIACPTVSPRVESYGVLCSGKSKSGKSGAKSVLKMLKNRNKKEKLAPAARADVGTAIAGGQMPGGLRRQRTEAARHIAASVSRGARWWTASYDRIKSGPPPLWRSVRQCSDVSASNAVNLATGRADLLSPVPLFGRSGHDGAGGAGRGGVRPGRRHGQPLGARPPRAVQGQLVSRP